jgi:hypothetical protein
MVIVSSLVLASVIAQTKSLAWPADQLVSLFAFAVSQ